MTGVTPGYPGQVIVEATMRRYAKVWDGEGSLQSFAFGLSAGASRLSSTWSQPYVVFIRGQKALRNTLNFYLAAGS